MNGETQKRKNTKTQKDMRGTFLRFCLCLTVFAGCQRQTANRSATAGVSAAEIQECSQKMQIVFPPGTTFVGYRKDQGMDEAIYLRCSVPADEVDQLLKQSPFRGVTLSKSIKQLWNIDGISWWRPEEATSFESGSADLPDAKYLKMTLDRSLADKVTVYLFWFET